MSAANGHAGYRLAYSGVIMDRLKSLAASAEELGLAAEFAATLRFITTRLKSDPRGWGNRLYDYHHLGMAHFYNRHSLLIVDYAVHDASRTVHIQNVRPNTGTPLDTAGSP